MMHTQLPRKELQIGTTKGTFCFAWSLEKESSQFYNLLQIVVMINLHSCLLWQAARANMLFAPKTSDVS